MSIDIIIEEDNEVLTLVVEDGLSPLSVSSDVGNILSLQPDGLFAPDTSVDKVDKDVGKSLVDDLEIAKLLYIEAEATKNDTDESLRDRSTHTGTQPISSISNLSSELNSKVDKEVGKSLLSDTEIVRLSLMEDEATKNRPDSENADKVHSHVIGDVSGLQNSLDGKVDKVVGESLISDDELIRLATVATDATKNASDASLRDRSTHTGSQPINTVEGLTDALDNKVDKVAGYSLVADDEIAKLLTVEQDAQKNTIISVAGKQGDVLLDKEDVGLGAVDNTSDADKPVSTAVADALNELLGEVALGFSYFHEHMAQIDDAAGLGDTDVTWSADKSSSLLDALAETIDSLNSRIDALNTRIDDLSVGEEEVVYFDEVINNILTSGSLSIEALPNFIISPLGEDVSVTPPAIQSDSATEGKWYVTLYGNEYDVTAMGISLGDNGELLVPYEMVSVSFGFPFTYRITDANSNMVQTQIYIYTELDTGDLEQIKLVDGPNILAALTGTLSHSGTGINFFPRLPIITLNENIVSLPESVTSYKHIRGYTIAQVEPTLGLATVYGSEGTLGYYNNYYQFPLAGDRVLEDNGYFLHIVCEGLVLVSKPIQYFNSRHHPQAESYPELADQYITDFFTHTVDFGNNYATVDQFIGDTNFIPIDDFDRQDTLESSVLFPYMNKNFSIVITTTENLIL